MVSGVFNGTGAAAYICLGFVPDYVKVQALATHGASIEWNKNSRVAAYIEGFYDTDGATQLVDKAVGAGIAPYFGGDLMTASNQTSTSNGEGVYLRWDRKDYRNAFDALVNPGDAVSGDAIAKFVMDTPSNRTGHFNTNVVGTYIGAGSKIIIGGHEYVITVLTAGQGISANDVTLSSTLASAPSVMSGLVGEVSNKFDLIPIPIGKVSTAGFVLNMTSGINANNVLQTFVAGTYDA
jgi:hypothetical protein